MQTNSDDVVHPKADVFSRKSGANTRLVDTLDAIMKPPPAFTVLVDNGFHGFWGQRPT